jgi:hypothetical protein
MYQYDPSKCDPLTWDRLIIKDLRALCYEMWILRTIFGDVLARMTDF